MSNGTTIICGTAGAELPDATITIYRGSVMDVALRIDVTELAAYPGVGDHKAAKFRRMVERHYEQWEAWLTEHGVPYTEHEPHSENILTLPPHS
jgi:hypothetical protein